MKKTLILAVASFLLSASGLVAQSRTEISTLATEIENDLTENILPFWIDHTVDPAGGFYGSVNIEGVADPSAAKAGILNARILWTFASAYRIYGIPAYKEMADRARDFILEHLIDKQYGGIFYEVGADGIGADALKRTYANAFTIYALSEHFRATGDVNSLDTAIEIYRIFEEKVHDKQRGGWEEILDRQWNPVQAKGVDGMMRATKTMNTHIHVMEAYTNLYRVWPDEELKNNIIELLGILRSKLYNPSTAHLILFCDDDWNQIGDVDSYGHDIETSWLMCEAAEVIADEEQIALTKAQAIKMVDTALAEGVNPDGSMIYEKSGDKYQRHFQWWPQCETVIGCINAWQITGEKKYFDAAARTWDFIKEYFIDKQYGEWYRNLSEDKVPRMKDTKASTWNCPYHNSRMGYEILARLSPKTVHSEVMAWSNITGIRLEGENIEFESSLRVGTPGGEIEATGREKQQKIKYKRDGATQTVNIPMHGAHFTQEVTDVDANSVNIKWKAEADETLSEGAYFCIALPAKSYANASIRNSGRSISITSGERKIELKFDRSVKSAVREENGEKVIYVTLMPTLVAGKSAELSATLRVDGTRHHDDVNIALDMTNPGREFAGFGGNFRIQNVGKDPAVIDYCLENMRVAYGRVEFPWMRWDDKGAADEHVRRSAEMAQKLKMKGMPVIVSCWFPPRWAGNRTTRSDGTSMAFSLKWEEKSKIFESMASYLLFLKKDYGVEADFFSFNESDLGINVVFTAEEHCTFIKEFGQYLADKGLKTRMLLGDNSDATTFDFIIPTLEDASAHKYVGAISFHSWRGCDDETLNKWAAAARRINVPLICGEGSTDAAAYQYPDIFNETTFALYEINLYTRICNICQPLSILQWQLTADYSPLWGNGIFGTEGPLRPTQRFFNLQQLSSTPEQAFAIPVSVDKDNVNVASFANLSRGECAVHIVNNAASCTAVISGLPKSSGRAIVRVTNENQNSEASCIEVCDGKISVFLPAASFISVFVSPDCAPAGRNLSRHDAGDEFKGAFKEYISASESTDGQQLHSAMVIQHGKVIAEQWLNGGAADKPHSLWSVSKTFTSAAVGFAVSEGLLSLNDKLISFFPDKLPENISENLAAITVHDLLTMNCGHDKEPDRIFRSTDPQSDWVKSFLEWPVEHKPGTFYCYNSFGTFMLSAIITKLTGQKVVDYLQPRLFDPLGIDHPQWDENPQGINCGGWGLSLKTEDLAKMGLCILNGGRFNGKQVIPADYVAKMTARQVDCVPSGVRPEQAAQIGLTAENSDWVQGYGYQMWRCRHNAVRADGANGQYIIVIPDKDAVVVTTAQTSDMQKEINLIWDYILPAL